MHPTLPQDSLARPKPQPGGPIDGGTWPSQITANVVESGPPARIHGYEVEGDLAVNYRFTDLVLLSLLGELPDEPASRAFDLALQLLAPIDVTAGPAHVAVLARICGVKSASAIAVTALALGEQSCHLIAEHADWLAWLAAPTGEVPARFLAGYADERSAAARLAAAVEATGLAVPALRAGPTRAAALLAILHACGLGRPEQVEAALVLARLSCALAESFAAGIGAFATYPMQLPPYRHEVTP
ncbi:MAG: hypothetical protein ABIY55_15420 [Kofleriaceae bacterium]